MCVTYCWLHKFLDYAISFCLYDTEDYSKWMDVLIDKGMLKFGTLSIIGGEPFLHSNLEGFIAGFKKRYDPMNIQVMVSG